LGVAGELGPVAGALEELEELEEVGAGVPLEGDGADQTRADRP